MNEYRKAIGYILFAFGFIIPALALISMFFVKIEGIEVFSLVGMFFGIGAGFLGRYILEEKK